MSTNVGRRNRTKSSQLSRDLIGNQVGERADLLFHFLNTQIKFP